MVPVSCLSHLGCTSPLSVIVVHRSCLCAYVRMHNTDSHMSLCMQPRFGLMSVAQPFALSHLACSSAVMFKNSAADLDGEPKIDAVNEVCLVMSICTRRQLSKFHQILQRMICGWSGQSYVIGHPGHPLPPYTSALQPAGVWCV